MLLRGLIIHFTFSKILRREGNMEDVYEANRAAVESCHRAYH